MMAMSILINNVHTIYRSEMSVLKKIAKSKAAAWAKARPSQAVVDGLSLSLAWEF
jgi:hypothetical protein